MGDIGNGGGFDISDSTKAHAFSEGRGCFSDSTEMPRKTLDLVLSDLIF